MTDEFAAVLRRLRRSAALTQEGLAAASGLSVEGISALERGHRRRPQAATVDLLVAGLDLDHESADVLRTAARGGRPARPIPAKSRSASPGGLPPRQLLIPPARYLGRESQVDDLISELGEPSARLRPKVVAISGMGGVGKSSMALTVADRVAKHYPDGQIYLDLRGSGQGEPMSRRQALAYVLMSLGERDPNLLYDTDLAAAHLRTMTEGARLLLLLDNVGDTAVIEPLLPTASTSAAIITSRQVMGGLPDARQMPLGPLDEGVARQLLAELVGAERISGDVEATRMVLRACAGLPLALRLVGARLQSRPSWSMTDLAEHLGSDPVRLGELSCGDLDLGAALLGSIDQLSASSDPVDHDATVAMHVVGLLPSPAVSPIAVAAASGWGRRRAVVAIERLVDLSLVEEVAPGRYRVHDLVHVLGAERAIAEAGEQAVRRVRLAVLRTYRGIAWRSRVLSRSVPEGYDESAMLESNDPTEDPVACLDLIALDIDQIVALIHVVVSYGPRESRDAAHVVAGLISYYVSRADSAGWRALLELILQRLPKEAINERINAHLDLAYFHGLNARPDLATSHAREVFLMAQPLERPRAEAAAYTAIGSGCRRTGRLEEAEANWLRALELATAGGDPRGVAGAYRDLSLAYRDMGDLELALDAAHQALAAYRKLALPRELAMSLVNLGVIYRDAGEMEFARTYLEESSTAAQTVTDLSLQAEALEELGYWHVLSGDPERGLPMLYEALTRVKTRGGGIGESSVRDRIGLALEALRRCGPTPDQGRRIRDQVSNPATPSAAIETEAW